MTSWYSLARKASCSNTVLVHVILDFTCKLLYLAHWCVAWIAIQVGPLVHLELQENCLICFYQLDWSATIALSFCSKNIPWSLLIRLLLCKAFVFIDRFLGICCTMALNHSYWKLFPILCFGSLNKNCHKSSMHDTPSPKWCNKNVFALILFAFVRERRENYERRLKMRGDQQ